LNHAALNLPVYGILRNALLKNTQYQCVRGRQEVDYGFAVAHEAGWRFLDGRKMRQIFMQKNNQ
jgi:hypothetical protein